MSYKLMQLVKRHNNAMGLPAAQREQYALAIAQLEREIEAERMSIHLDEAAYDRAFGGAIERANLQPHEIARIDWVKAAEIMRRLEDSYVTGNSTKFQEIAKEWRSFLRRHQERLLEAAI